MNRGTVSITKNNKAPHKESYAGALITYNDTVRGVNTLLKAFGLSDNLGSTMPGPFTSTGVIRVKFSSDHIATAKGFQAVVCCNAQVTTDLNPGELLINIFMTKSIIL